MKLKMKSEEDEKIESKLADNEATDGRDEGLDDLGLDDQPFVVTQQSIDMQNAQAKAEERNKELFSDFHFTTKNVLIVGGIFVAFLALFSFIYFMNRKSGNGFDSIDEAILSYVEARNEYDPKKFMTIFPKEIRETKMANYADIKQDLNGTYLMDYHINDYRIIKSELLNDTQVQHIEDEVKTVLNKKMDVQVAYIVTWEVEEHINIMGIENDTKSTEEFTVVVIKGRYYLYCLHEYEW